MESGFLRQYPKDRPFYDKKGAIADLLYSDPHVNCATSKILIFGGFRFFILQFTFHF